MTPQPSYKDENLEALEYARHVVERAPGKAAEFATSFGDCGCYGDDCRTCRRVDAMYVALKAAQRCNQCGRHLTDDESIERGIGPICWGNLMGDLA